MRSISVRLACLAVLNLLVLAGFASSAGAATGISLSPFFSTGSPGAGATMTAEWDFEGTEYFGGAEPITHLTLVLPKTSTLGTAGFASCSEATLYEFGPGGCPAGSAAGAAGSFSAELTFGAERVYEEGYLEPFVAPNGEILIYATAHSPAYLEMVLHATLVKASAEHGTALDIALPLSETVPGGPYVSMERMILRLGASHEEAGKQTQSLTFPDCPTVGTLEWESKATFANSTTAEFNPGFGCPNESGTAVVASNPSPPVGQLVTYTATVTPEPFFTIAPAGFVHFFDNGEPVPECQGGVESRGVELVLGAETSTAACSFDAEAGTHAITATYEGDETYLGSTSGTATVSTGEGAAEREEREEREAKAAREAREAREAKESSERLSAEQARAAQEAARKKAEEAALAQMAQAEAARKGAEQLARRKAEEGLKSEVLASLARQLAPAGKAARIASLVKAGAFTLTFTAPTAGTLEISWYELPTGAHLSARAQPVLVASGSATFTARAAKKVLLRLTGRGKSLLRHARSIKLASKGSFTPTDRSPEVAIERFTLAR